MDLKLMDAYRNGFHDRLCGKAIEDNPHQKPSDEWTRWAEGWMDQDRHLTDRDEALDSIGWFGARSR